MKGLKVLERFLAVAISAILVVTMVTAVPSGVFAFNGSGNGIDMSITEFGGVAPVYSGNSTQLTLPCVAGNAQNVTGKIQVRFPSSCTDPKVILKTPGGTIYTPGSSEGNTNGLATYTTTGTPEALYNDYLYPRETVYTVVPGTVNFGISGITIKADNRLATQVLPSTRKILIEVWYDGALQDSAWIDNIKIDNTQTPFTWIPFPDQYTSVGHKVSINTSTTNWFALQPNAYNQQTFLDSASVTVTPAAISGPNSGTSIKENGVFTNLDPTNWSMTTTGPGNTGSATFTRIDFLPETVYERPQFNIEYPSASFHDKDVIDYTLSFDTTYYDGITSTDPSLDLVSGSNGSNGGFNNQTLHVTLTPAGIEYTTNTTTKQFVDSNYTQTTTSKSFDARFGTDEGASGTLGQYYIGNAGGTDAGPSKITLDFDTADIGVKAVTMVVPMVDDNEDNENDQTVVPGSVSYTVYNNTTHTTSGPFTYPGIGTPMKTKGEFWYVTANDLGLADDEYIDTYSYVVPDIPLVSFAGYETEYSGGMYYGEIFNDGVAATSTVKVESVSAVAPSSQSNCVTNTSHDMSGIGMFTFSDRHGMDIHDSVSVSAGESGTIGIYIAATNGNVGSTTCPTIFIHNPTGATIDHDTIILKDKFGNEVNHSNLTITDTIVAGVPVVKIDTSAITDGSMVLNSVDWWDVDYTNGPTHTPGDGGYLCNMPGSCTPYKSEIYLQWTFDTTASTPSSNTLIKDMIFVQDSAHATNMNDPINNYWTYCTYGDPNSVTDGTGTTMGLMSGDSHFYEIKGHSDMVINNAIKYTGEPDSEYKTYTSDGAFLIIDSNTIDIKTTLTNNSEAAITDSRTYIPIPKKNEAWSFYASNTGQVNMLDGVNGSDPFAFSVELTQPVTNPDPSRFTITYGNIEAAKRESTTTVGVDTASFYPDTSVTTNTTVFPNGWASVNCIKIQVIGAGIAQNSSADIVAEQIKLTSDVSTDDLMKDIWMPVFYENYSQASVWYSEWHTGELMALQTQLGQIWGSLWKDDNIDGIQDVPENSLPAADKSGWVVTLYEKTDFDANGIMGATPLETTTTDAGGEYFFDVLDRNLDYVLVTTNSDPSKYSFTSKGEGTENYLNNVFLGDSTQTYGIAGAGAQPAIKAVRKVKETSLGAINSAKNGIYPIGLRDPNVKMVTTPEDIAMGAIGAVGSTITYTIYYVNTSTSSANITINDTVPTYTSFATATDSPSTQPSVGDPAGSTIEWTIPGVLPGTGGSVSFTVNVLNSAMDQTVTNVADVVIGTNPAIHTNQVETLVPSQSKEASTPEDTALGAVGAVGSTITYTINYSNSTSSTETVVVRDTVPAYTTFNSASTANITTAPTSGDPAGSVIEWTFPAVAPGVNGSVSFTVNVLNSAIDNQIDNTAYVKIGSNPDIATNQVHTVVPTIVKSVTTPEAPIDGATGSVGSTITYNIHYANNSSSVANVTIEDSVPAGTTYLSAVPSDSTLVVEPTVGDPAGSLIRWTIPSLVPGADGDVSFTVTVIDSAAGTTVDNTAVIIVGTSPAITTNTVQTDIPSTPIPPVATVPDATRSNATKEASTPQDTATGATGKVGSTITYTIWYENLSEASASDATMEIADTVPAHTTFLQFESSSSGAAIATHDGYGNLIWTIPGVASGTSGYVRFTVTVASDAGGKTIDNHAQVGIHGQQPDDTNYVPTKIPTSSKPSHSSDSSGSSSVSGMHAVSSSAQTQVTQPVVPEKETIITSDSQDTSTTTSLPKTGENRTAKALTLGLLSLIILAGADMILRRRARL